MGCSENPDALGLGARKLSAQNDCSSRLMCLHACPTGKRALEAEGLSELADWLNSQRKVAMLACARPR